MGSLIYIIPFAAVLGTTLLVVHLLRKGVIGQNSRSLPFHSSTLVSVLMSLPDSSIDELLSLYRKEFGSGPARYARRTLKKWREQEVQPSSQTYERFLVHLPKIMSYDLKCEVLRLFMEEYAPKDEHELDVYTDNWRESLEPLIQNLIDKAFTAQLPAEVEKQIEWLGDGDMVAAQAILRSSQAAEGRIMMSMLDTEFLEIEKLLSNRHLNPKVTHMLKFPYGTIQLNIRRR